MHYAFSDCTLDSQRQELFRHGTLVPLRRKAFQFLLYLLTHRTRVVSREELLNHLWTSQFIDDSTFNACLRDVRQAVGDSGQQQRIIRTLRGSGYRFVAVVDEQPGEVGALSSDTTTWSDTKSLAQSGQSAHAPALAALPPASGNRRPMAVSQGFSGLLGRGPEMQLLREQWAHVQAGSRRVVFVTGEAGIGKTTLVDQYVAELEGSAVVRIGHGQCLEQYGEGEAYLPVLEVLGRWCQSATGQEVVAVLQRHAPTWLMQMPALLSESEFERIQRRVAGATPERMLREMAEALEVLAAERPVVLVLEDLHWSDRSTVDLLAYLARRRSPACLFILATYRPADLVLHAHALHGVKQELQSHGQCLEVRLELLTLADVQAYITQRLGPQEFLADLVKQVYQRTGGHPLFMANVVEHYVQHGRLEDTVPSSVQEMIERQVGHLSTASQRVLEVGSVVGMQFAVATLVAALHGDADEIERCCVELAQPGHFLLETEMVEWPDGTLSGCYRFRHALYQQVLYQRLAEVQRVRLHRLIGAYEEQVHGVRATEVAAELAMHFERGRDHQRAVQYLKEAGQNAVRRSAYHEAVNYLVRGLYLLQAQPHTPQHVQQEIALQVALGQALVATRGAATPEVRQAYARARDLCAQLGETPQLLQTLRGLWRFYWNLGMLPTARALAAQIFDFVQRDAEAQQALEAHTTLGVTLFCMGDYATSQKHLEQGIALMDRGMQPEQAHRFGMASGVICLAVSALGLWCLGFPVQAVRRAQEALTLAQAIAHPYSMATARYWATFLYYRRRDIGEVQAHIDALLTLATVQDLPNYEESSRGWQGWVVAMQNQDAAGLSQLSQGLAALTDTGREVFRPLWLLLSAEATAHLGQVEIGLQFLTEAQTALQANEQGDLLAEVYRLQGACLLRQDVPDMAQAETCFQQALTVARRQQAKSWELRAAMSLSRLWQEQGRVAEARQLLAPIYNWFTEGFETADLQEAQALLATLA